jgi:hypothetical protein
MSQVYSMSFVTDYRNFDGSLSVKVSNDLITQLGDKISNDSILKGGSDFSQAVFDVYNLGHNKIIRTIPSFVSSNWYYCEEPHYTCDLSETTQIIKLPGQSITINNVGKKNIKIYSISKAGGTTWNVDFPIDIPSGMSKLF